MTLARAGVLLVDKPQGLTSFEVVGRIRRLFRIHKVGHTGTLDPFATGLLVLCLERATRLAQYITGWDKEYEGTIRLGQETDTDDPTGKVVFEEEPREITLERLEQVLERFRGEIQQIPPRYSAKKKQGVPSYRRARRGEEVELVPVKVRIDRLEVSSLNAPWVHFRARCSKGTYMRAFARDLGRALGCGAHLSWLRRTAVGHLKVEDALSLESIEAQRGPGREALLWPVERVLALWEGISLAREEARRVRYGQDLKAGEIQDRRRRTLREGQCVRLLGESGDFLGIGRITGGAGGGTIHPEMVWSEGAR